MKGPGKGRTNNPNGRPKGSQNRTTTEIKELINQFISGNLEDLQTNYDQLEAKDKLQFFRDLLKFVLPTQNQSEININQLTDNELDTLIDGIVNKLNK
ncbi:MAG: hypothetical protein WC460_06915 [Patescibacteria group bacterium]